MTEQDDKTIIRIKGEWYEVGTLQNTGKRKLYMAGDGGRTIRAGNASVDVHRHPLTPCSAPKAMTLGLSVLAAVKPELRPRVTGEFRPTEPESGERFIHPHADGGATDGSTWIHYPVVILSPPEPEPKPTPAEKFAEIKAKAIKAKEEIEGWLRCCDETGEWFDDYIKRIGNPDNLTPDQA